MFKVAAQHAEMHTKGVLSLATSNRPLQNSQTLLNVLVTVCS